MIKEASIAIDRLSARDRRLREMKYGRRKRMHYIDKLLNELEMLNLADKSQLPPALGDAVDRVVEDTAAELDTVEQRKTDSVTEAMDILYEIQDSLMFNQIEDE
jgi:hypothetical protein